MKAAIYCRRSKQSSESESIATQLQSCLNYSKTRLDIDEFIEYIDDGFSGGSIKRPMFKRLMEDARCSKYDILICYRLDRVSRNIHDFTLVLDTLKKYSIDFVSIKESFDTSTPMGRAMIYIASVFSQLERETIAERIKDNMYYLAQKGYWLGGKTPYGFKVQRDADNSSHSRLIEDKLETNNIRRIFAKYNILHSFSGLTNWCQNNGIVTRSNVPFSATSLRFILTNPIYATADKDIYKYFKEVNVSYIPSIDDFNGRNGLVVYNRHDEKTSPYKLNHITKWIVGIGIHEGIIDTKMWINIQNYINIHSIKKRLGSGNHGLISGIAKCGYCNNPLLIKSTSTSKKTYRYYVCKNCNSISTNIDTIDNSIIKYLNGIPADASVVYNKINHNLSKHKYEADSLVDDIYKSDLIIPALPRELTKQLLHQLFESVLIYKDQIKLVYRK